MRNLFYRFHSLLRRNVSLLERFLTAAGLAVLVYALTQTIPVYPVNWDIVVVGLVFLLTLWSPVAGYFAAVLAISYPLFTVSIYIAVLFLAIAVIGQHVFIQNLGATLLTLASPLLGGIYVAWTLPILGGLWWGPAGGALIGALAAFWGQLFAGMAGLAPDWLSLLGLLPDLRFFANRFASADSLETLALLFAPFAPNSTTLLYYVLQIFAWAFVGWTVGMLSGKEWILYRKPRTTILLAAAAAPLMCGLHVLLGLWLGAPLNALTWANLGFATLYSAFAAAVLEAGSDFIEHPLPLPASPVIQFEAAPDSIRSAPAPTQVPKLPPMDPDEQSDDLIMLELD
jgi:hypothetical protein